MCTFLKKCNRIASKRIPNFDFHFSPIWCGMILYIGIFNKRNLSSDDWLQIQFIKIVNFVSFRMDACRYKYEKKFQEIEITCENKNISISRNKFSLNCTQTVLILSFLVIVVVFLFAPHVYNSERRNIESNWNQYFPSLFAWISITYMNIF